MGVPTVLIARTDALGANLITSDIDDRDKEFLTGERTSEGFYSTEPGMATPIMRGLAYAPYADLIWCETSTPDLDEARTFAEGIHAEFPDKMLAYNCSPSFNWRSHLDDETIAKFQKELGAMGYKFIFITLAGWHALNASAFDLATGYTDSDMSVLVTGDLTDDGTKEQYSQLLEIISSLNTPWLPIPGNHDDYSEFLNAFSSKLPDNIPQNHCSYVIDDFPVRLVALDTSLPGQHDA